jgi:hypothetical protein
MPDIDNIMNEDDVDTYNQYVGARVRVSIGDEIYIGKVSRRKPELDGTVRGQANANSMLDTITYEIEFPDGCSDDYTANVISENIYMHSVTLRVGSTTSWKALWTTRQIDMPLTVLICTSSMESTSK